MLQNGIEQSLFGAKIMVKGRFGEASFLDDLLNTDGIISQLGEKLAGSLQDDESIIVHK